MAEEIIERRRVVIEYEIRVPTGGTAAPPSPITTDEELAERIERAMERNLARRGQLFNGAVRR